MLTAPPRFASPLAPADPDGPADDPPPGDPPPGDPEGVPPPPHAAATIANDATNAAVRSLDLDTRSMLSPPDQHPGHPATVSSAGQKTPWDQATAASREIDGCRKARAKLPSRSIGRRCLPI